MIIVGCDFHPSYQQVAILDTETGKIEEHKLMHTPGEAERFYRAIALPALVGIEAVATISGLYAYCRSSAMKCGSEMHLRSVPAMSGSRKQIDETQNIFCNCWWRDDSHVSGYPARRCVTIANSSSIDTSWYRYARGSRMNSNT